MLYDVEARDLLCPKSKSVNHPAQVIEAEIPYPLLSNGKRCRVDRGQSAITPMS